MSRRNLPKARKSSLTPGERFAGTIFFALYLLLLPLAAGPAFSQAERLLGRQIDSGLQSALYYYVIFAVTVLIFRRFLVKTSRRFSENSHTARTTIAIGLAAMYGLNLLFSSPSPAGLSDSAISSHASGAPLSTLLTVVFLAPFVEEVLFRGFLFGSLKDRNRTGAYAASCLLFALLHVWQFAVAGRDLSCFLRMPRYFVPGLVLAWAYDHSGTLWASVAIHAAANALSYLTLLA